MCQTKICSRCYEEKLITEFNREKRSKDGHNAACKICIREYYVKYYSENKDKWEEYASRPEVIQVKKKRNRKRYEEKKEEILTKNAEYYENNKKQIYENKKLWVIKNRDKVKVMRSVRRHRTRQATPKWLSPEQKKQIFDIYMTTSKMRSESGEKYEVDHIIPILGETVCGLHVPWNLQPLTQTENRQKSNKLLEEYADQW